MHPVLAATSAIAEELKAVAGVNPTFMSTTEKASALTELVSLESRLVELRLRVLAAAGDLADESGARDVAAWLTAQTRTHPAHAASDLKLATALDRHRPQLAAGLRDGLVNTAQARVIDTALDRLPDDLDTETMVKAEAHLVGLAAVYGPRELAKLGHHLLDVVAPEIAEEAEARRLADLEARAAQKTRLRLRRLGDGTTRVSGRIPDPAGTRLAAYLEAFTNPRKHGHLGEQKTAPGTGPRTGPGTGSGTAPGTAPADDPVARLPYPRRLGEAFCSFLEVLDPGRLPVHGGDATTVVITIGLDSLRKELGTAGILGGTVPGADGEGDRITAAEARRLACTAHLVPAVLGTDSEVLDLGRSARLFNRAQRKALLIRDKTCRAEGCDVPGTWAEAHHWIPWSHGGPTDLDHAVLLCSHHHHRAHDPKYTPERLSNGDVRFHRRR